MALIWRIIGWIAVALGFIGIFLPLLPTTPFLLLAAWAFTKGSPAIHAWLINHPTLGPPIVAWQTDGAISQRAKAMAILGMAASVIIGWYAGLSDLVLVAQSGVLTLVAVFILTRPSQVRVAERARP